MRWARNEKWNDPEQGHARLGFLAGPSSREVRIRVPYFSVVYFGRGTLPKRGTRALLGDLVEKSRVVHSQHPEGRSLLSTSKLCDSISPARNANIFGSGLVSESNSF